MKNEQSINEACTGRTDFQGESKVYNRFIPLRATPSNKKIPKHKRMSRSSQVRSTPRWSQLRPVTDRHVSAVD